MSQVYTWDPTAGDAIVTHGSEQIQTPVEEQGIDLNAVNEQRLEQSEGRRNQRLGHTGAFDPLEEGDRKLLNLTNLMSRAQRDGDVVAIKRLESMLDQLAAGEVAFKTDATSTPTTKKAPEAAQEAPQEVKEVAEDATTQTENERLVEAYKESTTYEILRNDPRYEEVINAINESGNENDIKAILTASPDDARIIFEYNKAKLDNPNRAEKVGFDDAQSQALTEEFGSKATEVVRLANAVAAGELTQSQAMTQAMADPQLMAVAASMLQQGKISFANN